MPWRFVDNWTEFVAEFQPRDPRPLSHRFCDWDATPDLAQATWEWPPRPRKLGFSERVCFDLDGPRDRWLALRLREHLGV